MPKTTYLANHLSSGELKEKYLQSKDSVETRRWRKRKKAGEKKIAINFPRAIALYN